MKLFIVALSFLVIYLPVSMAFFYLNLPLPLKDYSWSRVHDLSTWSPILYYTLAQAPGLQYYGWSPVLMGFFVFLYYGMNNEAIDMYRKFVGSLGAKKIWPGLMQPREIQRRSTSHSSWTGHFDLVGKALHYFDGGRKTSQTTMASEGMRSDA